MPENYVPLSVLKIDSDELTTDNQRMIKFFQ